jgi:hypothetical protein
MKYLPAIKLFNSKNAVMLDAILKGQLKLQVGQWVDLGKGRKLSRYISNNGGTIHLVHHRINSKITNKTFLTSAKILREKKINKNKREK